MQCPRASTRPRDERGRLLPKEPTEPSEVSEGGGIAVSGETGSSWLDRNEARELERFSRLARSGEDPAFRLEWMKQVMAHRIAKVKAVGQVGAAAVGKGVVNPLVTAAERVTEMSEAELVRLSGFDPIGEEEDG